MAYILYISVENSRANKSKSKPNVYIYYYKGKIIGFFIRNKPINSNIYYIRIIIIDKNGKRKNCYNSYLQRKGKY